MDNKWLLFGTIFGGLAVILGAFGAHALKNVLDDSSMNRFEIGVRYQMYHALLLLLIFSIQKQFNSQLLDIAGWAVVLGIILFSGSLYLLAFTEKTIFGAITPLGGVGFIIGWFLLAYTAMTQT